MAPARTIIRYTLITLAIILIVIQFIRPERNLSGKITNDISLKYGIPDTVQAILRTSCYDCHSNHTDYPWYDNIQPVAWWLDHHVTEGKKDLNFNEFSAYRVNRQYNKFDKITKQLDDHEMPLYSYTLIHRYAILSEGQKQLVTGWANAMHDALKAAYPADSLKMPKRKKD